MLPVRANGQSIHVRTMRTPVLPVRANGQSMHVRAMRTTVLPVRANGQRLPVRANGQNKAETNPKIYTQLLALKSPQITQFLHVVSKKPTRKPNVDQHCTSKKHLKKTCVRENLLFSEAKFSTAKSYFYDA